MALQFLGLRVLASAWTRLDHCYIQVPTSLRGKEKIWKKPTYYLKGPNLGTARVASTHDLLVKTRPDIHPLEQRRLECAAPAGWPNTQPQVITAEEEGSRFWWAASCLLRHIENMNTNRKQRGMWSFALKWGRGSISKEIFASAFLWIV